MDNGQLLDQARAVGHNSSAFAKGAWSWWSGEMKSMLPEKLRHAINDRKQTLLIDIRGNQAQARVYTGDRQTTLGHFDIDGALADYKSSLREIKGKIPPSPAACIIQLPENRALHRQLQLPLATEDKLNSVLGFEMDRLTPFEKDNVYFDFSVLERHKSTKKIDLSLTVAKKSVVDQAIDSLAGLKIRPTAVTVSDDAIDPREISDGKVPNNLLPLKRRAKPLRENRIMTILLPTLVILLAVVVVVLPMIFQRQLLNDLETAIAEVRVAATAAEKTRDAIILGEKQSQFFVTKRAQFPSTLQILDEVSRIVPDDTMLLRFEVDSNQLLIQGESTNASSLIGLLEGSTVFRNAGFSSPVTKNPRTNRDRFSLEAEIENSEVAQ